MLDASPDFLLLRQSILLYLEALGRGPRPADLHVLREGIARTEWKAIDRDRRIWALGAAAGDDVPFEGAHALAEKQWSDMEPELRRVLAERVLRWVRRQ